MTTRFFARTTLIAAVLFALVAGGVAAQDGATPTVPGNDTATPPITPSPTPEATNVTIRLSNTITLTGWSFENGVWQIQVRSRTVGSVTVTDATQVAQALTEGEGKRTGTAQFESFELAPGEKTTVSFDGSSADGVSAVTVAPNAESGRIAVLRTDAFGDGGSNYIRQSSAGLLVAIAVIGTGWFTWRRVLARLEDEDKEVTRHL
jgi:hypothetical protein